MSQPDTLFLPSDGVEFRLRTALQMLYDETVSYITLNSLGGMNNQCMRLAREALASPEVLRASSGSPSEAMRDAHIAMRAAYIELEHEFGGNQLFSRLLSKYAEACTAMGVAVAAPRTLVVAGASQ